MSIDQSSFYFICEQHLAELYRYGVDAYGDLFKEDRGTSCDIARCPLDADFEYFPGLAQVIKKRENTRLSKGGR